MDTDVSIPVYTNVPFPVDTDVSFSMDTDVSIPMNTDVSIPEVIFPFSHKKTAVTNEFDPPPVYTVKDPIEEKSKVKEFNFQTSIRYQQRQKASSTDVYNDGGYSTPRSMTNGKSDGKSDEKTDGKSKKARKYANVKPKVDTWRVPKGTTDEEVRPKRIVYKYVFRNYVRKVPRSRSTKIALIAVAVCVCGSLPILLLTAIMLGLRASYDYL